MPGATQNGHADTILYGDFTRSSAAALDAGAYRLLFVDQPQLFEEMKEDPDYAGWGYLRARDQLGALLRGFIDHAIAEAADDLGLSYRQLFTWANSRDGRIFLDQPHDVWSPQNAAEQATKALRAWLEYLEKHPEEA